MFCSEVGRHKNETVLRPSEGTISNILGCWRWNLLTSSFTPTISSGSSLVDLRLYVSVKRLMSGISQQGLAASHRLGSAAVSAVFTVKTEHFWQRRTWLLSTPTPVGFSFGLLFRLLVQEETAFRSDVEVLNYSAPLPNKNRSKWIIIHCDTEYTTLISPDGPWGTRECAERQG